SLINPSCY
ncbi:hypothetical protein D046_4473B, partial [Vibrio parahaemolyticus V-223/04]